MRAEFQDDCKIALEGRFGRDHTRRATREGALTLRRFGGIARALTSSYAEDLDRHDYCIFQRSKCVASRCIVQREAGATRDDSPL